MGAFDHTASTVPSITGTEVALTTIDVEQPAATALIVMVTTCVPVPPALIAFTVSINVPVTVGVPLITPVTVLMVIPAGNVPPTAKLVGVFVATMA